MQLVHAQHSRIGTCPHGLPIGACPICNGMMGGGVRKADFSAKPGEMSWNECAAIGAFLKAQKAAQQAKNADFQAHVLSLQKFQNVMANAAMRAVQFAQLVQNSSLPAIISKPVAFIANNIVANGLNFLKNATVSVSNFLQNVSQKLADISDKLTAMMGEFKAAAEKKVSEFLSGLKKKIKSIFAIFEPLDIKDDDKKVDEAKRMYELKTFLHKIYRKLRGNDND